MELLRDDLQTVIGRTLVTQSFALHLCLMTKRFPLFGKKTNKSDRSDVVFGKRLNYVSNK